MSPDRVDDLYRKLGLAEAYAVYLKSVARGDREAAQKVAEAQPVEAVCLAQSHLLYVAGGFRAVAWLLERELLPLRAELRVIRGLRECAALEAAVIADLIGGMYLCGVAAGSGQPPRTEHEAKAAELGQAFLESESPADNLLEQLERARLEETAPVVHAFDEVCGVVGVEADLVAGAFMLDVALLDELRTVKHSDEHVAWFDLFSKAWLNAAGKVGERMPFQTSRG